MNFVKSPTSNHDCSGSERCGGIPLDPGVEGDNVEDVEQLPLVLVDPLDLDVKQTARIHLDPRHLLEILGQLVLVVLLHLHHLVLEPGVLGPLLQLLELVQMNRPVVSNLLADQIRQQGITEQQPSSWSNSIRLVLKLFWPKLKEGLEERLLDEIRVDGGHTIDSMGANDGQVSHVDPLAPLLLNTRQLSHLLMIIPVLGLDLLHVEMVDVEDDLQVSGQELLHHGHGPPLQGLREDRVVGVGADLGRDGPGLVPALVTDLIITKTKLFLHLIPPHLEVSS